MASQEQEIYSLRQVMGSIQKTIASRYQREYWIKAEMNKLNYYSHSGHCYPELVEKTDGRVVAQVRSILWKNDFEQVNAKFLTILKEPLKDGIKVLFLAKITFDPVHGLSLRIIDIDPAFTLGDLEKEKQDTIQRLREEKIFDLNRNLQLPLLPQRIAVISVETSKGYADFCRIIEGNPSVYSFFMMLFPSILQGENAITSITGQLKQIEKVRDHFDVVAIIRGGGGDVGLSCYNNYELAKAIAVFPLPVITGIGHATNETVSEMISYENAITPTKIAEYLVQHFHDFAFPVERAKDVIVTRSGQMINEERSALHSGMRLFRSAVRNLQTGNRNDLGIMLSEITRQTISLLAGERAVLFQYTGIIKKDVLQYLVNHSREVSNYEKQIENLSPENVLKRGYSITYKNGSVVRSATEISPGDELVTEVMNGRITSTVTKKDN